MLLFLPFRLQYFCFFPNSRKSTPSAPTWHTFFHRIQLWNIVFNHVKVDISTWLIEIIYTHNYPDAFLLFCCLCFTCEALFSWHDFTLLTGAHFKKWCVMQSKIKSRAVDEVCVLSSYSFFLSWTPYVINRSKTTTKSKTYSLSNAV